MSEGQKYKPLSICFKKNACLIIGQDEAGQGKDGIGAKLIKSGYFHTGTTALTYRRPNKKVADEEMDE